MIKNVLIEGSRLPVKVNGIEVNFCKNPVCGNFGVPASQEKQPKGPLPKGRKRDTYLLTSTTKEHEPRYPRLECKICGEKPPIKSNLAVYEESERLLASLSYKPAGCPDEKCPNHVIDVTAGNMYFIAFGKTQSGSRRYRCKLCKTTFSIGASTRCQREPHKNNQIFRLLVNKMPLKRICEAVDISMPSLYDKIDFIHRQCVAFAAGREKQLLAGMPIRRLYIAVDRQDHLVNWTDAKDKRNVAFTAIASADNTTGYVFGMHLNFDPAADRLKIEADARDARDYEKRPPYRKYARLWLRDDYAEEVSNPVHYTNLGGSSLDGNIESAYQEAVNRDDVEKSERLDSTRKLPSDGMQVHSDYTLYGHFFFLKKLLAGAEKVRFFMDQESGIRAACIAAFADDVRNGRCDAFYVRINKDLTVDERKKALQYSRKEWSKHNKAHPDLSDSQLKLSLIKQQMKRMKKIGAWQDKWIRHPFPDMGEPEKSVCYLTDTGKYDEDHLAWLYNKASLHSIDRFFMQARRRISLLERPVSTASAAGRKWYGYSPYNPVMLMKMLDIFRVFYNYVETGKDGQSPAMRLGLAKGSVSMEDIIYYSRI